MEKDSSQDTRLRIIEAAIKMASLHGYLGATTKSIAKEAGVNEVTIFRLFGSKDNLFDECIETFGGPAVAPQIEAILTGDLRQDMATVAKVFYRLLSERKDMLKLALCESATLPSVAEGLARNPRVFRKTLARYLQSQMDKGVVKRENAEALAQAFLGMFVTYLISQSIFNERIEPEISDDEMVSIFVDIFMNGIVV